MRWIVDDEEPAGWSLAKREAAFWLSSAVGIVIVGTLCALAHYWASH